MRTTPAAIGSALWFVAAPGLAAGLVPWWITGWRWQEIDLWWLPARVVGGLLIVAGCAVLVESFVRFVREGHGTPVPIAAPERLVVGGWYRYMRNPMYVAVAAVIIGQSLLLAQFWLLLYAAVFVVIATGFVTVVEEPELKRRFGAEYAAYRQGVGRWIPRLTPWRP